MGDGNLLPEAIDDAVLNFLSYNRWQAFHKITKHFDGRFISDDLVQSVVRLLRLHKLKNRQGRGEAEYSLYNH